MTIKMMAIAAATACAATAGTAEAGLVITGVLDGTLTGGSPKVVEVYATTDIADLSTYAVSIASNGGAGFSTITADYIFPAVSLNAGDFYYAVGNAFDDMTDDFDATFPALSGSRSRNFGANSNGDDVIGLFFDATKAFTGDQTQVDVVGVLGTDGTGQAWEHTDGWLYRKSNTGPSTTFAIDDWTVSFNTLDGLTAAQIAESFPEGTYQVPEPASLGLLAAGGLMVAARRRSA